MTWKTTPTEAFEEYRKTFDKQFRASAVRILRCVVLQSPVDTGRFRGNWQVNHNTPIQGYSDLLVDKSGSSTISDGKREIERKKEPKRIFITNNVPYAATLNYGRPPGKQWSPQAPLLFMEGCVARERNKINRKKVGDRSTTRV